MKKRQQKIMNAVLGYVIIAVGIGATLLTMYYVAIGRASLTDLASAFFGSAILMYVGYHIAKGGEFPPFNLGHA